MPKTDADNGCGWLLVLLKIGWAILFSYLLLIAHHPDLGLIQLRSFEDAGHLLGTMVLAF